MPEQCIPFRVTTDNTLEGTEVATVDLTIAAPNSNSFLIIGGQNRVLINILDSDGEFLVCLKVFLIFTDLFSRCLR